MTDNEHINREHSWLSPSGLAPIVAGCVGKPLMEKPFPILATNEQALRGTNIHELAEKLLNNDPLPPGYDENHYFIAKSYVDYILEIAKKEEVFSIQAEKKVTVFPELEISGTGDCFLYVLNTKTLHLIDLKTGRIPVDVEWNPQLISYLYGYIFETQFEVETCTFHIFQPGNIQRPWSLKYEALLDFIKDTKAKCTIAHNLFHGKLSLTDGHLHYNDYCQYCRALPACPEARRHLKEKSLILLDDDPFNIPRVTDLTTLQKVNIFKVKKLLLTYLDAIEASLKDDLEHNIDIPDLELQPGKLKRQWNPEFDVAKTLLELGIQQPFRQDLITITEAEKQLKRKKVLIPEDAFIKVANRSQLVVRTEKPLEILEDI